MIKKYGEFKKDEKLIESCGGGSISSCGGGSEYSGKSISSCGGSSISSCGGGGNSGSNISSCGGSSISSCGGGDYESREEKIRKNRNRKFNSLFDEKSCIDCGEKLIDNAKFCHSCGSRVTS